jgi:uncharacterized protein YdiU (UPF0061 family)
VKVQVENRTLVALSFDRTLRQAPARIETSLSLAMPTAFKSLQLELISIDRELQISFGFGHLSDEKLLDLFSGRFFFSGVVPWAHAYGGHQFGRWAGQLGDGRAISVGEFRMRRGGERAKDTFRFRLMELSIKGSGRTAFSRAGDGRAVMDSLLREHLGGIALHGLGVPTVRSLLLLAPSPDNAHAEEDAIYRDEWYERKPAVKRAGMLTRCAPSFLRFGSFQLAAKRQGQEGLRKVAHLALLIYTDLYEQGDESSATFLAQLPLQTYKDLQDYGDVLHRCYFTGKEASPPPCLSTLAKTPESATPLPEMLLCLLTLTTRRVAALVAAWQTIGFVHGVMNTDNISIFGMTVDLNVYAFLTNLDEDFVPNYIDDEGRYAFRNQPRVMKWNLERLADAMSGQPFIEDSEEAQDDETFSEDAMSGQPFVDEGHNHNQSYFANMNQAREAVAEFDTVYQTCYRSRIQLRMGLLQNNDDASKIVEEGWLKWLKLSQVDYHIGSICLAELTETDTANAAGAVEMLHICSRSSTWWFDGSASSSPPARFYPLMLEKWFTGYHDLVAKGLRCIIYLH